MPISVLKFSGLACDRAGQQRPGDVLDRGLAGRAGDPDQRAADRAPPAAAPCACRQRSGSGVERTQARPSPTRPRSPPSGSRSAAWRGSTTTPQAPAAIASAAKRPPSTLLARDAEEQIAGPDLARVDDGALGELARSPRTAISAPPSAASRSAGQVDHAAPTPSAAQLAPAATSRSSNGLLAAALELLSLLVPLAGDHDEVPGAGLRRAPSRSPCAGRPRRRRCARSSIPVEDLGDDRVRVLGARVVGGDEADVGGRRRPRRPSAAASRGRGRRRSRRR